MRASITGRPTSPTLPRWMRLASYNRAEYGRLDGILHVAGIVRDSFVVNKTEMRSPPFSRPRFAAQRRSTPHSNSLAPELFVLFSSVSGVMGNPGQADYAAANGFLNAFAGWRNARLAAQGRRGTTVAMCWPLWQDGGMRLDAATASALEQNTGMTAMPAGAGLEAFYRALAARQDQVMAAYGDHAKLRATFLRRPALIACAASSVPDLSTIDRARLREQTTLRLTQLLGKRSISIPNASAPRIRSRILASIR